MIKWSKVQSSQEAGAVVLRHIYPLLSEKKEIFIQSSTEFSKGFNKSFVDVSQKEGLKAQIHTEVIPRGYQGLVLNILNLHGDANKELCLQGQKEECLKLKALRSYKKKERSSGGIWIQMWRAEEKKLILFIKKENPHPAGS